MSSKQAAILMMLVSVKIRALGGFTPANYETGGAEN